MTVLGRPDGEPEHGTLAADGSEAAIDPAGEPATQSAPAAPLTTAPVHGAKPARTADDLLADICPYLLAGDGTWRAARPLREHRCTAVEPAAPIAVLTQQRLCLTAAHTGCAAYMGAVARRTADLAVAHIPAEALSASTRFRALSRSAPLAMDTPGTGRPSGPRGRTRLGVVAIVAGSITLAAIVALQPPKPPPIAGASPSAPPSASPTVASPSVLTSPASPSASPDVSITPTPPAPSPTNRTYIVQEGDTLRSIAARFGTTVAAIKALNDLGQPPRVQVGQVLVIPPPS